MTEATQQLKSQIQIESPETIQVDLLEAMDYQYKTERSLDIEIKQPEFTSVCPMTGLPDFGCLTIRYRPDHNIVELKSLKYYLLQYRNVGIFYEHVVNKILNDLTQVIQPAWMEITGDFTARGGLTSRVTAVSGQN